MKKTLRTALALSVASVIALSGCAGGGASPQADLEGPFDWKRFDGEEITFIANQNPWFTNIEPYLSDFEELSGITVNVEKLPEDQFRQRLQVELTARSSSIDVYMSSVLQDGSRFWDSGWYENLAPYIENESLTSPDYNFDDFSDSLIEGYTFDESIAALPILVETQMIFYRKDLFEAAGITSIDTWADLEDAAEALHDPANGVYGIAARGKRAAAVTQIASFLNNNGAPYIGEDGMAGFDSPEGVEAFEAYGNLVREYGPSGGANNGWEEIMPLFQQGNLAMWFDLSTMGASLINPELSTVADQVGFFPMPAGPVDDSQAFFSWGVGVSSFSEQKDASWTFVQWLTSPEIVELIQGTGVFGGRESSAFPDTLPEDMVAAYRLSLPIAKPALPSVKSVPEARDIIGDIIVASILGEDVEAAVAKGAEELNTLISRE